jgi:hypothetical protein
VRELSKFFVFDKATMGTQLEMLRVVKYAIGKCFSEINIENWVSTYFCESD